MSQFLPPERVDAEAVQLMTPRPILSTANDCGGGAPPPATVVNVNPVCESRIARSSALTRSFTDIFLDPPLMSVTVTFPV